MSQQALKQVGWQKFQNGWRDMKFFYRLIFIVDFDEDSSDHSQTLPKYKGRHTHQKSQKNGNIYGHLAKIAIWNLKNWKNFKNNENFKMVRETWIFFIG